MSLHRVTSLIVLSAALVGCAPLITQSPGGKASPANVVSADDGRVLLNGADVVAYFNEGRYVQGRPELKSMYEGITVRFSKPENKQAFDREPQKYWPQYNGYCANGIVYSIPWGGNADNFRIIDGKLYIFGGELSREAFLLDAKKNIALADGYWKDEVAGSNAFLHRTWRVTWRVPHYKSGDALAKDVAAARGAKPAAN